MPNSLYKPDRKGKKYYKGRALVFMPDNNKQKNSRKKKSIAYQNHNFMQFGMEYSLFNYVFALSNTVAEFNKLYGDKLDAKHGYLILLIKLYCTTTNTDPAKRGEQVFKPEEIFNFYPNLHALFAYFAGSHSAFMVLFNDLMHLQFIKPHGQAYQCTTRVKIFSTQFDKQCKKLFSAPMQ